MQAITDFIYDLARKEATLGGKGKITSLVLQNDEWERVRLFCNLLEVSPALYILFNL
jgi:hypothetical protein